MHPLSSEILASSNLSTVEVFITEVVELPEKYKKRCNL